MKILIAGGAGFIGSHLCRFHLEKGDSVYAFDNLITGRRSNVQPFFSDKNFHFFEEDIVTFDFSHLPPFDIIYHLASPASPVQYKKYPIETLITNSQGTHKLLEFLRTSGSKSFVLASTSEVYGDPLIHPQHENYWGNVNPVGPRSCYDEGKRFAETLTMAYFHKFNLKIRIARIFNTYGPNMEKDDGRVVSNFITQALSGKPLTVKGKGQQTRSFCYISDMIEGLYLLAITKNIDGEIINLGNPNEKTVIELAKLIQKLIGKKLEILFINKEADDPQRRKPDIAKAKRLLGWQPKISLEEGLVKTIDYFREII